MKNTIIAMLLGAASLSVVSCGYLECLTAPNMEECIIGKALESAIGYLADANQINSQEEAEDFASKWSKAQSAVESAQSLGMDVPESVKKAYNNTLSRMQKHSYFNSPTLKKAMADAKYIK